MHVSEVIDALLLDLALGVLGEEKTPDAGQGVEGEDQNPLKGTIMSNDTAKKQWPVTRQDGYDEVAFVDEEYGNSAYVSHNDGEPYWRIEVALGNASAYHSSKEEQVAAARIVREAATCLLELNGVAA